MSMDEYKAFFKQLMDSISFDGTHMNDTEVWGICRIASWTKLSKEYGTYKKGRNKRRIMVV